MLFSANMATPPYAGYGERFNFSSAVLTLVFATYALVLIPALLVAAWHLRHRGEED